MAVGILALQGAFAEHAAVLDKLGVPHFEIRQKRDLDHPCPGTHEPNLARDEPPERDVIRLPRASAGASRLCFHEQQGALARRSVGGCRVSGVVAPQRIL